MAGIITFSTSIIKGGVEKFALKQPIFLVCLVKRPSWIDIAQVLYRVYSPLRLIHCIRKKSADDFLDPRCRVLT